MTLFEAVLNVLERGLDVRFRTDVGRDVEVEVRQVVWDPEKQDAAVLTNRRFVIDAAAHLWHDGEENLLAYRVVRTADELLAHPDAYHPPEMK